MDPKVVNEEYRDGYLNAISRVFVVIGIPCPDESEEIVQFGFT